MWLSLGLHTRHLSTRYRTGTNPFTGEEVRFHLDDGLTHEERSRLEVKLLELGASPPDPDGYRTVRCADGGRFNISVLEIHDPLPLKGCHIEILKLTNDVVLNIFEIAAIGNMAIQSAIGREMALTTADRSDLENERWPNAKTVSSAKGFADWLKTIVRKGGV